MNEADAEEEEAGCRVGDADCAWSANGLPWPALVDVVALAAALGRLNGARGGVPTAVGSIDEARCG